MAETKAIHAAFGKKRAALLNGLRDLGFTVDLPPRARSTSGRRFDHPAGSRSATAWRSSAPRSIANVITVPGEFFDVDTGKRRGGRASRFRRHLRFSFGPPLARITLALERFKELVTTAS